MGGLFFGVIVLVAVVWLVRTLRGPQGGCHRDSAKADREDALRLLDQRLAAGAITPEEYERLRRAILS